MRKNDTGEFELVVGDRQLLSAFFIVVLLCAVAFAMGYVVGQNAPKSGKTLAENVPVPQSNTAADARPQPLAPAPAAPQTAPAADPAAQPSDGAPQPTTQAAQGSEPPKADPPPPPAAQSANASLVEPEDLPEGNFWQVMAVGQQTAEMMRTTLKDHGFKVILSPGSKGLIRVLVGPYPDTQALGKAKTELEASGMHPVRFKP
jgi:cell division septation protein DedD